MTEQHLSSINDQILQQELKVKTSDQFNLSQTQIFQQKQILISKGTSKKDKRAIPRRSKLDPLQIKYLNISKNEIENNHTFQQESQIVQNNEKMQQNIIHQQIDLNNEEKQQKQISVHEQQQIKIQHINIDFLQQQNKPQPEQQIQQTKQQKIQVFETRKVKRQKMKKIQIKPAEQPLKVIQTQVQKQTQINKQINNQISNEIQVLNTNANIYYQFDFQNEQKTNNIFQHQFTTKNRKKKRKKNKQNNTTNTLTQGQLNIQHSIVQKNNMNESTINFNNRNSLNQKITNEKFSQMQQSQNINVGVTQNLMTIIKILGILLLFAGIGVAFYFNWCKIINCNEKSQFLVSRKLKRNQCFYINYTKTTETIISPTQQTKTRTNQSMYYCIKKAQPNGDLNMAGFYKTISEEDLNQTNPSTRYFNIDPLVEQTLFKVHPPSKQQIDYSNPQVKDGISFKIPPPYSVDPNMADKLINSIVVFEFNINENGTLYNISFNSKNDNRTLGQLPKLIKLFFPKLNRYLYDNQPNSNTRLLLPTIDAFDKTKYNYRQDQDGSITLESYLYEQPNDQSQINATNKLSVSTIFNKQGYLQGGALSGSCFLQSDPPPPQSSSKATLSMPAQMKVNQNLSMKVIYCYNNLTDNNIAQFYSFYLALFLPQKSNKTMTQQQMYKYFMDQGNSKGNLSSRLLQDTDMSTLTIQRKDLQIFSGNVLGMPIGVVFQSAMVLNAKEISEFQCQTQFKAVAQLLLYLGIFEVRTTIFQYSKSFEPLELDYTLFTANQLVNKYYPTYRRMVEQLSKAKSFQKYTSQLRGLFVQLKNKMLQAISLIKQSKSKLLSAQFVAKLIDLLKQALLKYTQLDPLVKQKDILISQMTKQLFDFTNVTYSENLKIFKNVQNTFNDTRNTAVAFLYTQKTTSIDILSKNTPKLQTILIEKLETLYNQQIQRARQFFDLYTYWRNETETYLSNLTESILVFHNIYETTLLDFLQLFYTPNWLSFNTIVQFSTKQSTIVNNSYNQIINNIKRGELNTIKYFNDTLFQFYQIGNIIQTNSTNQILKRLNVSLQAVSQLVGVINSDFPLRCAVLPDYWWFAGACFSQKFKDTCMQAITLQSNMSILVAGTYIFGISLNSLQMFINNVNDELSTNNKIQDKFVNIDSQINMYSQVRQSIITVVDSVTKMKDGIIDLRKRIFKEIQPCCQQYGCCEFDINMVALNITLNAIIDQFNLFLTNWSNYINIDKLDQYVKTIHTFDKIIYINTITYFNVSDTVHQFYHSQLGILDQFKNISLYINQTKYNFIQDYLVGKRVYPLIQTSYRTISNYTRDYCDENTTKDNQINDQRTEFNDSATFIYDNTVDNWLMHEGFTFLYDEYQYLSENAYVKYTPLDFCNNTLDDQIDAIVDSIEDSPHFEYIENNTRYFLDLVVDDGDKQLTHIQSIIELLDFKLYRIYNQKLFQQFINNQSKSKDDIVSWLQEWSGKITVTKAYFAHLFDFFTPDYIKTQGIILRFNKTMLQINYALIYPEFSQLKAQAQAVLNNLNYQIFFSYIVIKLQIQGLGKYVGIVTNQTQKISQKTHNLTQTFIKLPETVTQDYLADIQTGYERLKQYLPTNIYDKIEKDTEQFNKQFSKIIQISKYSIETDAMKALNMTNPQLFRYLADCTNLFSQAVILSLKNTNQTILLYNAYVQNNIALIKTIKIGFLNTINQIAKYSQEKFRQVQTNLTNQISVFQNYIDQVTLDYSKIPGVTTFVQSLMSQFDYFVDSTVNNISGETAKYIELIKKDSQIFANFSITDVYKLKVTKIREILTINTNNTWNNLRSILQQITIMEKSLSSSTVKLMYQLSFLEEGLTKTSIGLQKNVDVLDASKSGFDSQIQQLLMMLFTDFEVSFKRGIIENIIKCKNTAQIIQSTDLKTLVELQNINLPASEKQISDIMDQIKIIKDNILSANVFQLYKKYINQDDSNANKFMKNKLTQDITSLRKAFLKLSSIVNSKDPKSQISLYQYTLYDQKIPIFEKQFYISTPIGVFTFGFNIQFLFTIDFKVILLNLRSIDVQVELHTSLALRAYFSYGIPKIIQVGAFLRGHVMKVIVTPGISFQNVVPIQLIQDLKWISQIADDNKFKLKLIVDVELQALSCEYGGFYSHVWVQIYWIPIQIVICIKFLFIHIHIEIRFKIPWLKFTMKTTEWKNTYKGVAVYKERVLDLSLFEHQF